jgi:hypothetical protein
METKYLKVPPTLNEGVYVRLSKIPRSSTHTETKTPPACSEKLLLKGNDVVNGVVREMVRENCVAVVVVFEWSCAVVEVVLGGLVEPLNDVGLK